MPLKRIFALSFAALLAVVALRGQSLSDDEIKLDSRPYIPSPEITIRKQTNLTEVRVVVRDSKSQPVPGLQQSDFEVLDNGKPQTITLFRVETLAAPPAASGPATSTAEGPAAAAASAVQQTRYVALVFDDQNMPLRDLTPARTAAQSFIISHLQPGDHVAIFTSTTKVTLEFTQDRKKLLDALAAIRPRLRAPGGGSISCPPITPYHSFQIDSLHDIQAIELGLQIGYAANCLSRDPMQLEMNISRVKTNAAQTFSESEQFARSTMSVLKSVVEYLGKMQGSRLLVLASSGFLTTTTRLLGEQNKLVDIAVRNNVVINTLSASGLVPDSAGGSFDDGPPLALPSRFDLQGLLERLLTEQRTALNDPLAGLADGTGGRFFHNNNDLDRGLRVLGSAPEVSYLIGFTPETLHYDGTYHTLKVRLANQAGYKVDARPGYMAPERPPPPPSGFSVRFENLVMAKDTLSEIQLAVSAESARLPTGESGLRVSIRVDPKSLPFQRRGDRSAENLRFILALFDADGKFLAATDNAVDLTLKDETLARLSENGLKQSLTLQAPPGSYKLRVVLEELMNGKMAALTRPVEIH